MYSDHLLGVGDKGVSNLLVHDTMYHRVTGVTEDPMGSVHQCKKVEQVEELL